MHFKEVVGWFEMTRIQDLIIILISTTTLFLSLLSVGGTLFGKIFSILILVGYWCKYTFM